MVVDVAVQCLPELLELLVLPVVQERLKVPALQGERALAVAQTISSKIGDREK